MTTIIIIILVVIVVYKLIANNYINKMKLINKGMGDITNDGFAIIQITSSSFVGTLKTEGYETYTSPNALGFILNGEEIMIMPTVKKHTLAIGVSKLENINEDKMIELIENN